MIARFNHFPNMPNWIRIDWPACSDRKNEHKAHKIIQQVFRDLSQTPTKVQPLSCQLALCTKLSIRVPTEIWGPSSERYHFPGKEVINLSFFGFQLPYEFYFEGDFVYFDLGLQGILSPMLTVLSLTNCIICLADVMRVLEYSPNIQSCTLKKIVYYKKLPYSSLLNPILANSDNWTRIILLRSLVSLTIESDCSLTQLFHYAELPMLQSLYLSLDGNGLSDLDEYLWKDSRSRSVTIECFSSCWLGIHDAVKDLKFKNLTCGVFEKGKGPWLLLSAKERKGSLMMFVDQLAVEKRTSTKEFLGWGSGTAFSEPSPN
ncbi:hypothetical protein CPB84DRAFT_1827171 [Gymnopilus junonius]|uniref:Uncharacterized protein n=1 Tax=Gymnopilus junonius TaxID=109634 RepID=A0A9P5TKI3_GYMJU|nr:hypothetical protein CPB84DRAFT_1827171 [Gymnopilus junonius]